MTATNRRFVPAIILAVILLSSLLLADSHEPAWSADEQKIADQIKSLRGLPDDTRARVTKDLAIQIRHLPAGLNKLRLAFGLSSLSTEGDFGHDTLQEVTTTLAEALQQSPIPDSASKNGKAAQPYVELAALAEYEHVDAPGMADVPQFREAMAGLEANDQARQHADFTLTDIDGKKWTLKDLRGKVVLVNFWATWCPPCRKEIPDLISLYQKFQNQGLVILGISDENADKVATFRAEHKVNYPILIDADRAVHKSFMVQGIPKSFIYDRDGKLVTESIDMRTQAQFLRMLAEAGLK